VKDLKESYAFEQFDDSPLHQSIKVFADFVARGRRHEIAGHLSEALLHYVIALELTFGERQAIQRSVSKRVALITHRQNGRSFTQQQEWIDAIYDLRSRYVHDGKEVTDEPQLQRLRILCEQVFRSLLRLQAAHPDRSSRGKETMTKWLHEVDYFAKGLIAGKQPTESQLHDAFVG
jgi:Apea-like HEPN